MADKQVRIDLIANDKASRVIEDVADEAKDLEQLEPEVEVTADVDKAERDIEEIGDDLAELKRRDTEIELTGKISNLKAQLEDAEGALKKVRDQAEVTERAVDDIGQAQGPRLAGNTVADLTGPLGEASGMASDVGGVFDGLGDSAEAAWIKMGGSEQGAAKVASALGGLGFVVSGAIAAWSLYTAAQEKARRKAQELEDAIRDIRSAIQEGDYETGAEKIMEEFPDAIDAARTLGVSFGDLARYITGTKDELDALSLEDAIADYQAQGMSLDEATEAAKRHVEVTQEERSAIEAAREQYRLSSGDIGREEQAVRQMADGMALAAGNTEDMADAAERSKTRVDNLKNAMDKLKGSLTFERAMHQFNQTFDTAMAEARSDSGLTYDSILDMKDAIFEVAEYAGLTPVEVQTLLDEVEQGDLESVKNKVNGYYQQNPAGIDTTVEAPSQAEANAAIIRLRQRLNAAWASSGGRGTAPIYGPSSMPPVNGGGPTPTPVVNVTQHVPRGYRGDLLTDARVAARRSGGLYQRNRR